MPKRSKTNVRLEEGYSYVVAPIEIWRHVVTTYRTLGTEQDNETDRAAFYEVADGIEQWAETTLYESHEVEDEW